MRCNMRFPILILVCVLSSSGAYAGEGSNSRLVSERKGCDESSQRNDMCDQASWLLLTGTPLLIFEPDAQQLPSQWVWHSFSLVQ